MQGGILGNRSNGYEYSLPHSRGGKLSASQNVKRSDVPRPSVEDLAPYSAANYTGRGSKRWQRYFKRQRVALITAAAAIIFLLVIPGIALVVSAQNAMNDARTLKAQAPVLLSQIQSGDVEGSQRTANDIGSVAERLDANVNSPLWAPLTLIPVYGSDVSSVRTLASVANILSEQVLIPITQGLPTDGTARLFVDGGFNISMIQSLLNPIAGASQAIQACEQRINETGDSNIEKLQAIVVPAKHAISALSEISGYAGDLSRALPDILGANASRTYLVLACSESELRSVGGFPGSAGLMTVENGKLAVGAMEAPRLPVAPEGTDYVPTTDEEKAIFGTRVGRYFYDAGYIPHFPRAAEIMKGIWDANDRPPIDGIISVDPVFLQTILSLTGGVTTSEGIVVDGTNAAAILMNTIYSTYSVESFVGEVDTEDKDEEEIKTAARTLAYAKQDGFFSEVASLALDMFFENIGTVDMLKAIQELGESIADKHIYVWMCNPEEQLLVEKLDAGCSMSVSETSPEVGIYIATTVATKTGWYAITETTVGEGKKNPDGSTSYAVQTRIKNTLTPEEGASLPETITNPDQYSTDRIRSKGDMILDVYLSAPAGGTITDIHPEGIFASETLFDDFPGWYTRPGAEPMTHASYNGRDVWYGVTMIEPQQSTTITYTVTTSPLATEQLTIDSTPLGQG